MSIMKETHSKMRNNGESVKSFKRRFTTERSRQFDILQAKEAISVIGADGSSESRQVSFPYQGTNGLALKQGEEFAHSFNVKQIKCIEAKLTKVTQDIEALVNKKSNYNSIFKGILKQHINKRRRKKENRRKSNERKRKRTVNNVQGVYGICVGNPLGNDLPQCLVYPPRTAVPEECIKVEDVATSLF